MPVLARPRRAERGAAAVVLAGAVAAGLLPLVRPDVAPPPPRPVAQARAALPPEVEGAAALPDLLPDAALLAPAVETLLDRRGTALLARDRAGFLATVDAGQPAFLARQAALFDALAEVPLTRWSYALDPTDVQPDDPALTARYGTWWAPAVTLRHALAGVDAEPFATRQALTFVLRADGWKVAADDDFEARGDRTDRALWDGGPVVVARGTSSLVLGHPADRARLPGLARDVDAAVPRVTAVWGDGWAQRVAVVVPADQDELDRLVDVRGGLDRVVALALAGPGGGDRVLVNPGLFAGLGPVGRGVVLAHELTHVAARSAGGPAVPRWLSEGLADAVGYAGTGVPVRAAAPELTADVRAGRVPAVLPPDDDFAGDAAGLTQAYEGSWLAVELLLRTYGRDRVLALYRELGSRADPQALEELLRDRLGTSTAELTARWAQALREQLG